MSKLIYCSYSIMDQDSAPDWITKMPQNPVVQRERWGFYNPALGFVENFEHDLRIAAALSDQTRIKPLAFQNQQQLRLDPMLFHPLTKVMDRMKANDQGPSVDLPFKNLYALIRSDIVLLDLNVPEHGEKSQEVLYAYLCNIPVVGIAHRFILSPWIVGKVKSVIFPSTTDEIVQQVLAYDHKTTAMIEHYRAVEKVTKDAEGLGQKLEEAKKAMAEQDPEKPEHQDGEQPGSDPVC